MLLIAKGGGFPLVSVLCCCFAEAAFVNQFCGCFQLPFVFACLLVCCLFLVVLFGCL